MRFTWTKQGKDAWTANAGPFALVARAKGDGRWDWNVTAEGARSPEATGIARSEGAAKTASEQYAMRSGRV